MTDDENVVSASSSLAPYDGHVTRTSVPYADRGGEYHKTTQTRRRSGSPRAPVRG